MHISGVILSADVARSLCSIGEEGLLNETLLFG
jgi:hypothetical protein